MRYYSTEKEKIKFSILVPVYNVEMFIIDCLDSIHNQTYNNYEVIIVDDGSTDHSGKLCDSYCADKDNFFVYHKENGGLLETRRFSLKYVTGDYILFVDSDDKIKANTLFSLNQYICQYKCTCCVFGYERFFGDNVFGGTVEDNDFTILTDKRKIYRKFLLSENYNAIWRKATKSSCISDDYKDLYFVSKGEDLLQSIEIYKKSQSILVVRDIFYQYRVNPNSITNSNNLNNLKISFVVPEYVFYFLKAEDSVFESDIIDFLSYCLSTLCTSIKRIAQAKGKLHDKINMLMETWESDFYQNNLRNLKSRSNNTVLDRFILRLFKFKRFYFLVLINILYRNFKNLKGHLIHRRG